MTSITAETTLPYASLRTTLKQIGRLIPANDAWIAALAIQHGLPILTRDEHFDGYRMCDALAGRRRPKRILAKPAASCVGRDARCR
jgi:predicted nucleic acid-binding protein